MNIVAPANQQKRDKFGENYEVSNQTNQSLAFDSTKASKDYSQAWTTWLQPKAETSQIEFKPVEESKSEIESSHPSILENQQNGQSQYETQSVPLFVAPRTQEPSMTNPEATDLTPKDIKKRVHDVEVQSVLLAAEVLGDINKLQKANENEHGFSAIGERKFNTESENLKKDFEVELEKPAPQDPTERYLFERETPPQEFKQEINVERPLKAVDFGFFFTWMFGGARETFGGFFKKIKTGIGSFFGSMNILSRKEVFFADKKPLSQKEQETEQKRNQNKTSFFANLKNQMAAAIGLDRKRAMRQQIEMTNKQAGFSNLSYEGASDQFGQIRENVLVAAEKGNSQKTAEQLNQEKQKKLSFMSKGKAKSGPGITFSADKSHNFNNAAKLAG